MLVIERVVAPRSPHDELLVSRAPDTESLAPDTESLAPDTESLAPDTEVTIRG